MRVARLAVFGVLAVSACAAPPLGPLVPVVPGPNKPFAQFQDDDLSCRSFAQGQVAGEAEAVNQRAVGGAVLSTALGVGLGAIVGGGQGAAFGAVTGAGIGTGLNAGASAGAQGGIQYQYDNAYAQCMYAHGNQVPGYAPPQAYASYAPAYAPPTPAYSQSDRGSLIAAVQGELDRLGYLAMPPDGIAGRQTTGAIRTFQEARDLPVDGVASPFLLDRLREIQTR